MAAKRRLPKWSVALKNAGLIPGSSAFAEPQTKLLQQVMEGGVAEAFFKSNRQLCFGMEGGIE
jgi:hypothetical protein